jgi:uncharacterized protein involved in exopolysaccharide biosynthesis
MVRRRRKVLFLCVGLMAVMSTVAAFVMTPTFESATTILVRQDQVLNPLVSFTDAGRITSEDRLRTFNEIIYSHTTLMRLHDSLAADSQEEPGEAAEEGAAAVTDDEAIVRRLRDRIETERRASDSFRLRFSSSNPARAKKGVEVLTELFIQTHLDIESKYDDDVVAFYEAKLKEIAGKFAENQRRVLATITERKAALPSETYVMYTDIMKTEDSLVGLAAEEALYAEKLKAMEVFPGAMGTPEGNQTLAELQRTRLPFADDLRELLTRYDSLGRRFSRKYPDVVRIEEQILALIGRMRTAVAAELDRFEPRRLELEARKAGFITRVKASQIGKQVAEGVEYDYAVYRKLYDDMTVKLEQAKTTRDLSRQGGKQFRIIDPALLPVTPVRPDRPVFVAGAIGLGLLIGCIGIFISELLDSTLWSPEDLEIHEKPVIAYIGDGSEYR